MGHFLFLVLHVVCLLAFFPALIVTVPLHIIYAFMHNSGRSKKDEGDYKICPACAESIRVEAKVCRYCGRKFSPLEIAEAL
jgi:hypothetical protein